MKKNLILSLTAAFLMMKTANACSFTATLTSTPVYCFATATGSISVNTTGGIGSLTYSLNGGPYQSTPYFYGFFPGTYTVTVLDDGDLCSADFTITLSSPPPVIGAISSSSTSCTGLCDASLVATASGGTPPYTFAWSTGSTTPVGTALCPGTYTCMITDAMGCTASATGSVVDAIPVTATVTSSTPATCGLCDGQAVVTASGGTAPYMYQVDGGAPQGSATFTGLCAGTHTLMVTDANGCTGTVSFALFSAGSLTLGVSAYILPDCGICDGEVDLVATGGTSPYTYSAASGSVSASTVSGLCAGANTYTVTDDAGCTQVLTYTLSNDSIPGISVTAALTAESGYGLSDGSIDITVSGAPGTYTFLWNNGATTEDIYSLAGGTYSVTVMNGSGQCNTYNFTITTSITFATVKGKLYIDANNNCIFDTGDSPVPYYMINGPGTYDGMTNWAGDYSITIPSGIHTFAPAASTSMAVETACTSGTSTTTAGSVDTLDFPMTTTSASCDGSVAVGNSGIVPGFTGTDNVWVNNAGYIPMTAVVKVIVPQYTTFSSAIPAPASVSGDTAIFNVTVAPLSFVHLYVYFDCPATPGLLGTYSSTTALLEVSDCTDANLSNNSNTYTRMIAGSFDPNEKTVTPPGDVTLSQQDFTYSIAFQNTGNGPAVNITVTDTLSDLLDPSTIEILAVSHDFEYHLLNGNILHFRFNNIMLPDSTSDEPNSHGNILFRIKRKSTVGIGDQIDNTANIYFDFNPAVITNTTHTLFVTPTNVSEAASNTAGFSLYPNPNDGMAYLRLNGMTNATCSVYDVCGRVVITRTVNTSETALDLSKLGRGVYTVMVSDAQHHFSKQLIRE